MSHYEDDDDDKPETGKKKKLDEFDCPSCNANNPWPDGLSEGEEINCHYCGTSYLVRFSDEGKLKLKEI
jgi:DNA-directed RNA polymerase subunit RPC12/RpoP